MLREAGRVASAARDLGARLIVKGARVRDVCEAVEAEIRRRGAQAAFPVQSSRNEIAAHYCPAPEDETAYQDGDLAKLDVGVHLDGYVVDTAVSVSVGGRPENRHAIEATRAALDGAVRVAGPGVEVRRLSEAIESTVRAHGLRPVKNLCGHGVGRWTVHCPPAIPSVASASRARLPLGAVVAIEPFATDGEGVVAERGVAEVFRLDPRRPVSDEVDDDVMGAIRAFHGLPFSRRQLSSLPRDRMERVLATLLEGGGLMAYAPLVETSGRPVAQAEHTIYIGASGVEILTC